VARGTYAVGPNGTGLITTMHAVFACSIKPLALACPSPHLTHLAGISNLQRTPSAART
jgi:hypothetical protein